MISKGILYILISTASFALVNTLLKLLPGIPVHETVFFRSVITLSMTIWLVRRKQLPFFGNNHFWLLIRGIFGVASLMLFFTTLQKLPMATATTVQYLSQIFTVVIAIFLNGEKVKPIRWLLFTVAFGGVILMEGAQQEPDWYFVGIGALSALFAGIAYNAIIKCKYTDHPYTVVMAFPLIATPITGIWCLFEWVTPQGVEWVYLLLIGLITQLAQVFMTMALHAEKAAVVTPFKYLGSVYALLLGFFFFGELFPDLSLLGMVIVLLAVIGNALIK